MADEVQESLPIVRLGGAGELGRLLALVTASPEAPAWPADAWTGFLLDDMEAPCGGSTRLLFGTATPEGQLAGVAAVTLIDCTAELELLLVHPGWRRRGLGRLLSQYWLRWAERAGAMDAVLEVRASNRAAQSLYGELGFQTEGRRTKYYHQPEEDALLMRKALHP